MRDLKDREETAQAAIDRVGDLKDRYEIAQATIDRVGDLKDREETAQARMIEWAICWTERRQQRVR